MTLATKLFGTSGIRGLANKEITPFLALDLGLALATKIKGGRATLGMDTRVSSPMIANALTAGLMAGGCEVLDLGVVPTPVLAYLTKSLESKVGVMVTASHNPPEYNGMKLFNCNSMAYEEEQQTEISRLMNEQSFSVRDWYELGSVTTREESAEYLELFSNIHLNKKWQVVLDPGCGATYNLAPKLFSKLGCKVKTINAQPDGNFPGRSPEPSPENLKDLCTVVKETDSDIGFAYDGDGDRFTVVGESGEAFQLDRTLAAYAKQITENYRGGVIVTTVEASTTIDKAVELADGTVKRTAVGDVNISTSIMKLGAIFGGEPCGAWIHPQYHLCPDGILSSLKFLEAMDKNKVTASQYVNSVPSYPVLRSKFRCPNHRKNDAMKKLNTLLPVSFKKTMDRNTVDGLRLDFEDSWILVRPSGTEPFLRLTVEAKTRELAEQLFSTVAKVIKEITK